jgi:hypothetical protein
MWTKQFACILTRRKQVIANAEPISDCEPENLPADHRRPRLQVSMALRVVVSSVSKHVFKVLSAPSSEGAHETLIAFLIREQRS